MTIDDYVAEALDCRDRGFPAYKLHPFAEPRRDVEVCRAVRAAVGPEMKLMLDPSCEYDHEHALRVGRELERLDFHLEVDARAEVHVPAAPGLGAEIDWDLIDAHTTYAG